MGRKGVEPARESPTHPTQMLITRWRAAPVQLPPPAAHATASLPQREEGVEDDAIHAIVDPLQQLGVILRQVIGRVHARSLARFAAVSGSCSRSEPPLYGAFFVKGVPRGCYPF